VTEKKGLTVHAATAMRVSPNFALAAVDTILKELSCHAGQTSLALDVRQLHAPFEATISVPVEAHVDDGPTRQEWRLRIQAATNLNIYPRFEGVLSLKPASVSGSELQLDGRYIVPFGALGRTIDSTLLHGAAQSTLQRFVRDIATRVAALSHWTNSV
jgi:hypothetical protein